MARHAHDNPDLYGDPVDDYAAEAQALSAYSDEDWF
jgi:hypothetical protein